MKWLFLVHQVRTPNSRERVKVWRLTKKVGAILYRNSVYVLPFSKERLEDFHWLCQQIRDSKGEAAAFVTEAGNPAEDRALKQLFFTAREKEYRALEKDLHQFELRCKQLQQNPSLTPGQAETAEKGLRQLEETFRDIRRVDFFRHPSARHIEKKLKSLRLLAAQTRPRTQEGRRIAHYSRSGFRGRTWTTREHIHIDRLSSAWLIRRFIDPQAKFIFAAPEQLPRNAIPFDILGAEFSHQGERCTFETLLEAFHLKNPALTAIAELVHEIDLKDRQFHRPEAPGLDLVVRAIANRLRNDHRTLDFGFQILDALYQQLSTES